MSRSTEERNMELMQTLDDAWNAQDIEIFRARHKPNVIVRWPGKTEPTVGIEDHTHSVHGSMKGPMKAADGSEIPPTGIHVLLG